MLTTNTQTIAKLFNTTCSSVEFSGVSINSRENLAGKLFIAIVGEKFNGHQFINKVVEKGAVAIVASQKITTHLPIIYVKDTILALGQIAHFHRTQLDTKIIAITGSNGKTTTKNMLFNMLNQVAPTLKTKGNLNNHFGVPLTLLNLNEKHQFAIIEMGANHLGEIAYLRNIAKPDIALVINTLDAHIGEFGGFENLVQAKQEIFHKHCQNIVNTQTSINSNYACFSFGEGGDIFATQIQNTQFTLNLETQSINITLNLLGKHNIENALAASSCAYILGIDIDIIKQGLENTQTEKGRLELIKSGDNTIIDDSYNASPTAIQYALDVLADCTGEKVAVLGNMAELGDKSHEMHAKIGEYAKNKNIDYLYSIGTLAKHYGIVHFNTQEKLLTQLKKHPTATILLKGSRIANLDKLISQI